jgi:uncharacterized membrane protein
MDEKKEKMILEGIIIYLLSSFIFIIFFKVNSIITFEGLFIVDLTQILIFIIINWLMNEQHGVK